MQYKVLVVDDETDVLSVIEEMLGKLGFETTGVTSGVKAIELVKSNKYDLVITDLIMPGVSGLDIINEIKLNKIKVPVLITAGVDIAEASVDIPSMVRESFIKKPFTLDDIKRKICTYAGIGNCFKEGNLTNCKMGD